MDEIKKTVEVDITKKEKGEIEITASLDAKKFDAHRADAVKKLGKDIEVDGYRKGKAPEAKVVERVGEQKILSEMAEIAISKHYNDIIRENELRVIGRPEVQITKMAMGNPLEFKITTATIPEVDLPDYKKLATGIEEKPAEKVEEKDIEDAIQNIIRNFNASQQDEMEKLDELNDENIAKFGPFTDMKDFKGKLQAQLEQENTARAKDKRRMSIAEAILDQTKIELPEVLVNAEIGKMLAEFRGNVEQAGIKFEDYLKQAGKTAEDMSKEVRPEAEKRAKLQLVLNEIAGKEKVDIDPEELKKNVDAVLAQNKDADKVSAQIYIATMMTNEAVFKMLEETKEEKGE